MNKSIYKVLLVSLSLFGSGALYSQVNIEVSFDKKVILLFENEIEGYEIGDKETVGCVSEENRIILQTSQDYGPNEFFETNLLVWTVAGNYFTFVLNYNNKPSKFFHVLKNDNSTYSLGSVDSELGINDSNDGYNNEVSSIKDVRVDSLCQSLIETDGYIFSIGSIQKKMELAVSGIYVDDEYIYVETYLYNAGNIKYDIDVISFFIDGKGAKKRKKTAVSKENLVPDYVFNGGTTSIDGGTGVSNIFVFKRFTIDEDKEINCEFFELNGDRDLTAVINSSDLIDAKDIYSYLKK